MATTGSPAPLPSIPPGELSTETRPQPALTRRETDPWPAAAPLPQQFGPYRILRQLGAGGMGTVYLAEDTRLERQVALKVPHFDPEGDRGVLERFDREAKMLATLDHPNICPVHEVGQIDGIHYLTMAYIEGESLSRQVGAQGQPPREVAALVRTLALALDEAHQKGVIHRDLKPSNILINQRGEPIIMDMLMFLRRL